MRSSAKKMEVDLNQMYDVSDVETGYRYWFSKLLSIVLSIFEWKGLPDSLPSREIEIQLILFGHCVVFVKNGKLVTTHVDLYGIDDYYQPTNGTYAQPILGSSNLTLNGYDNILIWNSPLQDNVADYPVDNSLYTFIARYARRLADLESTSNNYAVINRAASFPVAKNDKVRQSIHKFLNALSLGKREIISDDAIIEGFKNEPFPKNSSVDDIIKWEDARDKVFEQFYRDLGVKFRNNKRAQMTDEEVEADDQVLLIALDDLQKAREKSIPDWLTKFGLNVSVELNPKFDINVFRGGNVNE